jgi:hypothetical protein
VPVVSLTERCYCTGATPAAVKLVKVSCKAAVSMLSNALVAQAVVCLTVLLQRCDCRYFSMLAILEQKYLLYCYKSTNTDASDSRDADVARMCAMLNKVCSVLIPVKQVLLYLYCRAMFIKVCSVLIPVKQVLLYEYMCAMLNKVCSLSLLYRCESSKRYSVLNTKVPSTHAHCVRC